MLQNTFAHKLVLLRLDHKIECGLGEAVQMLFLYCTSLELYSFGFSSLHKTGKREQHYVKHWKITSQFIPGYTKHSDFIDKPQPLALSLNDAKLATPTVGFGTRLHYIYRALERT